MLNAKLVIVGGKSKTKEVRLHLPTTIGRGKEADLTIPHALVSRAHSRLFERDGQLCVKDLGSLNGTFVGNKRIENEQIISPNQLLTLGNITFRAVYEIDQSAKQTLPTNTPDSLQTVFIDPKIGLASHDSEQTVDVKADIVPVIDHAEPSAPRSAISEIDSFDPDEIGSLDTPEKTAPKTAAPKHPVSSKQTIVNPTQPTLRTETKPKKPPTPSVNLQAQPAVADAPIDLGLANLTEDAPQLSSVDVDLDLLQDNSSSPPVSFVGNIHSADDSNSPSIVDDIQIDLGLDSSQEASVDESELGSFLKNLPK